MKRFSLLTIFMITAAFAFGKPLFQSKYMIMFAGGSGLTRTVQIFKNYIMVDKQRLQKLDDSKGWVVYDGGAAGDTHRYYRVDFDNYDMEFVLSQGERRDTMQMICLSDRKGLKISKREVCETCQGFGRVIIKNSFPPGFIVVDKLEKCDECNGKEYYRSEGHEHILCDVCGGKGYFRKD